MVNERKAFIDDEDDDEDQRHPEEQTAIRN
jgi:hypothetical protein